MIGAALCQRVNNKLVVIEYASRSLADSEKHYTATEKECLGMKWAAERWRLYLLAAPTTFRTAVRMDKMHEVDMDNDSAPATTDSEQPHVTFQTDHSALTSLQRKRVINNSRLAHWITTMAEFDYTVEYLPV